MSDVKVLNVSATPVNAQTVTNTCIDMQQTVEETMNSINESLNSFSNEIPQDAEVSKAKNFLNNFSNYIKGDSFKNEINETAKKYGIPPKKLAKNFFEKVLGTIGDVLGIAISAVDNAAHMVVNILSTVVHGAVNIIVGVANALASIVTLNKTCIA